MKTFEMTDRVLTRLITPRGKYSMEISKNNVIYLFKNGKCIGLTFTDEIIEEFLDDQRRIRNEYNK
jgi:hypothetical protein